MRQASFWQRLGLKIFVLLSYVSLFFFLMPLSWQLFWLVVGVVCGVVFLLFDELVGFRWYQEKPADSTLTKPRFLVSRSPLFLISLPPIALMVFTSFGSFWATGVLGGMMLWLLLEMVELRRDSVAFDRRFLPTIKGQVSPQHIQMILLSGWAFFVLLHLLVMI